MAEQLSTIDPDRFKHFVKHICVMAHKHKKREEAKEQLHQHLKEIKKEFPQGKNITEHIDEVHEKIDHLLEREKKLFGVQSSNQVLTNRLMDKVRESKQKVDDMHDSLADMRQKLDDYIEHKTSRENRIKALETKLKKQASTNKDINKIKEKIKSLESVYQKVKHSNDPKVPVLKDKLEALKARVAL